MEKEKQGQTFWRRGSFTVEAAVIVPLAVLLVAALVMLCFAAHDRAYYTGAACEAALLGSAGARGQESAEQRLARRVEERVLPGAAPQVAVTEDGRSTEVIVSGERSSAGWGAPFLWEEKVRIRRIHPAEDLRNLWFLRRLGETVLGET